MNTDNIIADLLDAMQHAIRAGDWTVDGACDPGAVMERAGHLLRSRGWTQNSIARFTRDGHVHQVYLKDGCVADQSGDPGFAQVAERADRR